MDTYGYLAYIPPGIPVHQHSVHLHNLLRSVDPKATGFVLGCKVEDNWYALLRPATASGERFLRVENSLVAVYSGSSVPLKSLRRLAMDGFK